MTTFLRNLGLGFLPLCFGLAAGEGFAYTMQSCGRLVGPIFAAKCRGRQLEYQLQFQTAGTAAGSLVATGLGLWLELRRRRVVQQPNSIREEPS